MKNMKTTFYYYTFEIQQVLAKSNLDYRNLRNNITHISCKERLVKISLIKK